MRAFGIFHKHQSLLLCSGELPFFLSLFVFLLKMIHDGKIVGLKGSSTLRWKHALIAKHFAQIIELYDLCKSGSKKQRVTETKGWQAIACEKTLLLRSKGQVGKVC